MFTLKHTSSFLNLNSNFELPLILRFFLPKCLLKGLFKPLRHLIAYTYNVIQKEDQNKSNNNNNKANSK